MSNPEPLSKMYTPIEGGLFMTGSQALIRLALEQRWKDTENGLNTAGFFSGYRGSPMTSMDQQLWYAEKTIKDNHIHFWPGINENLAMTSVWGTQQVDYFNDANYDGVFSLWYGKGPGLDQSLDALRQGNWYGSATNGGVLILAGDDPCMRSTVNAYHSELLFEDLLMPVLYPADIQEVLYLGLKGIALSRFSGAWVGFKLLPETIETASTVLIEPDRKKIILPDYSFPTGGVNTRYPDSVYVQEERIREHRLPAALAFSRANNLNKITHDSPQAKIGIAAMGKTWCDTLQALRDLGFTDEILKAQGIRILKISMPFPTDLETYKEFALGLESIIVIEEKREQIENGIREVCYRLPQNQHPKIIGRRGYDNSSLLNNYGELTVDNISQALAVGLKKYLNLSSIESRINNINLTNSNYLKLPSSELTRIPYFCSGCPHNSSIKTPEGSMSFGGVGCHYMATWMDRDVHMYTHMGGEGIPWVGQAPFVKRKHVFQNLGEGTYYHSGSLAIRAAIAAGVNITYKILYNDAVAMTGGQPVDGPISVNSIAEQVRAEGVERIAIVSDEPKKFNNYKNFPDKCTIHHRRELNSLQKELREINGVSVLIYDQTCAAEKRRRRKRGEFPNPAKRMFINDRVCEGCGDCSIKSNCLSIQPIDTDFGRKKRVDQSSCNKDYSCNDGFCPSFVTVLGAEPHNLTADSTDPISHLEFTPDPKIAKIDDLNPYDILISGVGGTGVVTIGLILGMAAHLEGLHVSVINQLGFAQKGGPVKGHLKFSKKRNQLNAARLNINSADLILGSDLLVASDNESLHLSSPKKTKAIVNTHETITGEFTRNPDLKYPTAIALERLTTTIGEINISIIDATEVATKLLGDPLASNLIMMGFAWQKGLLPISKENINAAIEANKVKIDWNKQAFAWGRIYADDPGFVEMLKNTHSKDQKNQSLEQVIQLRAKDLTNYQNQNYADQYSDLVEKVKQAEQKLGTDTLTREVAKYAYKLMAYKDEYEVARLHSDPAFIGKLKETFGKGYKLKFNLAPPLLSPIDKKTGLPRKIEFGGWMLYTFKILSKLKGLRGTAFDIFGYTKERKTERALIPEYFETIESIVKNITPKNRNLAVEIARLPDIVRGYGYIKDNNLNKYYEKRIRLLEKWEKVKVNIL